MSNILTSYLQQFHWFFSISGHVCNLSIYHCWKLLHPWGHRNIESQWHPISCCHGQAVELLSRVSLPCYHGTSLYLRSLCESESLSTIRSHFCTHLVHQLCYHCAKPSTNSVMPTNLDLLVVLANDFIIKNCRICGTSILWKSCAYFMGCTLLIFTLISQYTHKYLIYSTLRVHHHRFRVTHFAGT